VLAVAGTDPQMPLADVGAYAARVERLGFDALHVVETVKDPFVVSALALEHTSRLVVRTSVALAFIRSPLLTAYSAWSLAELSGGRFDVGLGTQIRQNIAERYGMPWTDDAAARLGDYAAAVRAAFAAFQHGAGGIDHRGTHWQLTRLQPEFVPPPLAPGVRPPQVWIGGVNRANCRVAGRLAAGYVTHPTNSHPRYLAELALPAIAEGLAGAGRDRREITVVAEAMVLTGPDAASVDQHRGRHRAMLAFLYSTPAYRRTLELFGWEEVGDRCRTLTREGRWSELDTVVPDELVETLTPVAPWATLPQVLHTWYGGLADGVLLRPPTDPSLDLAFAEVVAAIRNERPSSPPVGRQ
jgi:probable F420-dependent oxidoreductase